MVVGASERTVKVDGTTAWQRRPVWEYADSHHRCVQYIFRYGDFQWQGQRRSRVEGSQHGSIVEGRGRGPAS